MIDGRWFCCLTFDGRSVFGPAPSRRLSVQLVHISRRYVAKQGPEKDQQRYRSEREYRKVANLAACDTFRDRLLESPPEIVGLYRPKDILCISHDVADELNSDGGAPGRVSLWQHRSTHARE